MQPGYVSPVEPSRSEQEAEDLQGRLMQVSRLATIGEMAAGVAHELNQPLAAITTYAQAGARLLERSDPALEDVHEALKQIAAQAMRAGAIIRRMRSLVRHVDVERRATDLNALINELAELMETDARVHGVRLRFELAQGLPQVMADRVQIQHVLLNLLRNALEALADVPAAERAVIVRTALGESGDVELSLSDTGPGIDPEVAERMYDPFFTTKALGTGLGLSVSTTIIGAHDGTLGHRANEPRGASFFVRLPAA